MDERIDKAIEKWRKILLMEDWDISWEIDETQEVDALVHTHCTEHRLRMAFLPRVLEYSDRELDDTVGHEMLHAIIEPIRLYVGPWAVAFLPGAMCGPFWENFNNLGENLVIDDLVRILRAR